VKINKSPTDGQTDPWLCQSLNCRIESYVSSPGFVPALVQDGSKWVREVLPTRTVYGAIYAIHRYRPRVDGLFSRFERWINTRDPADTFWRSITKDNLTTWYGRTEESRIVDPDDHARVFSWLICESYDDMGNVAVYRYKPENTAQVDLAQANERNRARGAARYLKRVLYGRSRLRPTSPTCSASTSCAASSTTPATARMTCRSRISRRRTTRRWRISS
jgi:hypothetical protein